MSPQLSRGLIQLVCSIIHEHQTAGWMLTPATARTGLASSCYSLGSYRPAAAHSRDALQLLPKTSAIASRKTIIKQTITRVSHPDPWDEVSSLVVVGAGGRPLHGCPHAVFVVLTDKNARQLPQRSHVERLEQLALIGSKK